MTSIRQPTLSLTSSAGLADERKSAAPDTPTVTMLPVNYFRYYTVNIKSSDGSPLAGVEVTGESRPISLTEGKWRNAEELARRFGKSEARVRELIDKGQIRLGLEVIPEKAWTDENGKAVFRLRGFNICGNEDLPAADMFTAVSKMGISRAIIKSAVEGLEPLEENILGGVTTSGLIGRHVHPLVNKRLKAIGQAWQRVEGMSPGVPKFITITGASMRWGGLNPPHQAHRCGGSVDIRPIGTGSGPVHVDNPTGYRAKYYKDGTAKLIDILLKAGATQILFSDHLPGATYFDGHKDHMHVSWLKNPSEPWDAGPDLFQFG